MPPCSGASISVALTARRQPLPVRATPPAKFFLRDGVRLALRCARDAAAVRAGAGACREQRHCIEVACRTRGDAELIREHEILAMAPKETGTAREPLRWSVDKVLMGKRETFSVVPDGLIGLRFSDESAAYFLLEVDRGTIPISRTDTAGSSAWRKNIAYKLTTYYEGWKVGRHVKQFGLKPLRVAMVTTSAARVKNMRSVVDQITEGRGTNFFVFIDQETLRAENPLDAEWVTGKGEHIRLV